VETPKKLGEWEPTSAGPKREHVRGSRGSNWVQKLRTTFEKIQLVESYGYLEDYYNFHKLNLEFFVHFYIKKKKESY